MQILPGAPTRVWSYEGQLSERLWRHRDEPPGETTSARSCGRKAARRCASSSTTTWPKTASSTRMACGSRRTAMARRCRPSAQARPRSTSSRWSTGPARPGSTRTRMMRTAEQVYHGHGRAVLRLGRCRSAGCAGRRNRRQRHPGDHPGPQFRQQQPVPVQPESDVGHTWATASWSTESPIRSCRSSPVLTGCASSTAPTPAPTSWPGATTCPSRSSARMAACSQRLLPVRYVMLMPGERVDVWVDFSSLAGKQVILRSLSFEPPEA